MDAPNDFIATLDLGGDDDTRFVAVCNLHDSSTEDGRDEYNHTTLSSEDESDSETSNKDTHFNDTHPNNESDESDGSVGSDGSLMLENSSFNLRHSQDHSANEENIISHSNTEHPNDHNSSTHEDVHSDDSDSVEEQGQPNLNDSVSSDKSDESVSSVNSGKSDESVSSVSSDESVSSVSSDKSGKYFRIALNKDGTLKQKNVKRNNETTIIYNKYMQILIAGATGLLIGFWVGVEYKSYNKSD